MTFRERQGEGVRERLELAWPVRFESEQLRHLVRWLGVTVTPMSPVHGLIDAPRAFPAGGQDQDPAAQHPAGFVRALWTLAAPRRLILLRLGPDRAKLLRFASDGEVIVRFEIGRDGGMVSEPCSHDVFAEFVCSAAGPFEDCGLTANTTLSRQFLEALSSLYAVGLFGGSDAAVSRRAAEDALDFATSSEARAPDLLRALEEDGVLTFDETAVRANPAWKTAHPYLAVEAALKMRAIDLEDARRGRTCDKAMAILGREDRRLVVVPPLSRRDALIELLPVTRATVAAGLSALLSPPTAPSGGPVVDYDGVPSMWLRSASADDASEVDLPPWRLDALADLAPAGIGSAAPVLLGPGATIEFISGDRRGAGAARHVFALSADEAAEWTLDGSMVRWRPLTQEQLSARAEALIPASAEVSASPPVELTQVALDSIIVGRDSGGLSDLPAALHGLATDSETRWCSVRATYLAGTVLHGCVLLIATSSSGESWRFEPNGEHHKAVSIVPGEIRSELISALTPAR